MEAALKREKELRDQVINRFPHAIHSHFLVGRDPIPFGDMVFCDGDLVGRVAAFRTGRDGWVISQFPNGDGGYVLHCQNGNVRRWSQKKPRKAKRRVG